MVFIDDLMVEVLVLVDCLVGVVFVVSKVEFGERME